MDNQMFFFKYLKYKQKYLEQFNKGGDGDGSVVTIRRRRLSAAAARHQRIEAASSASVSSLPPVTDIGSKEHTEQRQILFDRGTSLDDTTYTPNRNDMLYNRIDMLYNSFDDLKIIIQQQSTALHELKQVVDTIDDTTTKSYTLELDIRNKVKEVNKTLKDFRDKVTKDMDINSCFEMIKYKPKGSPDYEQLDTSLQKVAKMGYGLYNRAGHLMKCLWNVIKLLWSIFYHLFNTYRGMWRILRNLTNYKGYGSMILSPPLFLMWGTLVVVDIFVTYLLIKYSFGFFGAQAILKWIEKRLSSWIESVFETALLSSKSVVLWTIDKLESELESIMTKMLNLFGRLSNIIDKVILKDEKMGPMISSMIKQFKRIMYKVLSSIWNTRCMFPPLSEPSNSELAICGRQRTFTGRGMGCSPYPCWISDDSQQKQTAGYDNSHHPYDFRKILIKLEKSYDHQN